MRRNGCATGGRALVDASHGAHSVTQWTGSTIDRRAAWHGQSLLYAQECGWDVNLEALVAEIGAKFVRGFILEKQERHRSFGKNFVGPFWTSKL